MSLKSSAETKIETVVHIDLKEVVTELLISQSRMRSPVFESCGRYEILVRVDFNTE